ncbi:EF-hand domain-containing protein [Bradyrhizobium sp. Arg237L]|uniref:EF-hand domain-containing protein n=1 Tax=Bradyrhizobium sp. Arg237L TaxID=3003352 RepID=UPI00249F10DF|nr:EF-hand domain-containing protein [Bradyrhizobium sp. Arg237L]MDI4238561.1 EF-hand domain-containing protein [Bradyrhizobium sp. Arg237L]
MLFALGAASSAIDLLKSLTSSKTSQAKSTGLTQDAGNIFDISGATTAPTGAAPSSGSAGSSSAPIAPETMSALLDAQSQASTGTAASTKSRSDALKDLFGQIDGDGNGKITKSEFEDALGAGGTNLAKADDVFSKLDKDGNGSVTLDEMSSALKGGSGRGSHVRHHGGGGGGSADALMQALDGTSASVTNSDGSVTTTTTYADGSKVTATSAASSSAARAATSSYNSIDQLVQRQAVDQLEQRQASPISAQAWASLSVSA